MKKMIILLALTFSASAFSQVGINEEEIKNGLPGGSASSATQTVKVKKPVKAPPVIAPITTTPAANCADHLAKGDSGFTACEAGKRTR